MITIVPIVEGQGEVESLRILLGKLIDYTKYAVRTVQPKNAHGWENLIKANGIEKFLELARREKQCDGVLVLVDADYACPVELGKSLAKRARSLNLPFPVAIVCAKCEFEAWFLASLESIAGQPGIDIPAGVKYEGDVESRIGAKGWLEKHMPSGTVYKETADQPAMTKLLDPNLVRPRSRSFHRLEHALQELLAGEVKVTPE